MDYIEKKKSEDEVLDWLKTHLNEHRLSHSIGCAKSAVKLAEKFGLDEKKAYVAGLLHDCAKCFTKEKMLEIIEKEIPDIDKTELFSPKTLHAPVSAYIAEKEFGVKDKDILSSIRWHTLGKLNMSDFEKIIFLADKIEPNTRHSEYRTMILQLLEEEDGLNKALLMCYKETIKSLVKRDLRICMTTIDIYNQLQGEK